MYEARDYETRIWWSVEDQLYVAQCVEMPGIMAHGISRSEAAQSIQDAIAFALECYAQDQEAPPAPRRLVPVAFI